MRQNGKEVKNGLRSQPACVPSSISYWLGALGKSLISLDLSLLT